MSLIHLLRLLIFPWRKAVALRVCAAKINAEIVSDGVLPWLKNHRFRCIEAIAAEATIAPTRRRFRGS